jgi:hypothetical protein
MQIDFGERLIEIGSSSNTSFLASPVCGGTFEASN